MRRLINIQGWQTLYPGPKTTVIDPIKDKYPYLLKDIRSLEKIMSGPLISPIVRCLQVLSIL